mmetsp:Transcript_9703/g.11648  ORF Transcript_9703/g.11648 Transcript_9703/m.11648 type:complete len:125 (+) Transcript_9703:680-1054(+)
MSGIRVLMENRGVLRCCDLYPNIDRIKRVGCPVLVIHGTSDLEVGFNHGLNIQSAVPSSFKTEPCWVEGGGHNNIVDDFPQQYYPRVKAFIEGLRKMERADETLLTASSFTSSDLSGKNEIRVT